MPISINGTGSITGLSAGGLPDGTVTAADLASGAARTNFGAGAVLQVVQTAVTAGYSFTNTSFADLTGMTATITPSSASNKILILVDMKMGTASNGFARLLRNGSNIYLGDSYLSTVSVSSSDLYFPTTTINSQPITYLDSPSSASAVTYKIQVACYSASYPIYFNVSYGAANQNYAIRTASSITLMEIAA